MPDIEPENLNLWGTESVDLIFDDLHEKYAPPAMVTNDQKRNLTDVSWDLCLLIRPEDIYKNASSKFWPLKYFDTKTFIL